MWQCQGMSKGLFSLPGTVMCLVNTTAMCTACPQVPVAHGKADLTIYRDAGAAVIKVLSKSGVCERASIDEAYLDVTAAAQELLAEARKGGSKNSNTGSGVSTAGAAVGQLGAGASDETAAEEASGMQVDEQLEPLGDTEGGLLHMLPLPETFEGWHVAGVVSHTGLHGWR